MGRGVPARRAEPFFSAFTIPFHPKLERALVSPAGSHHGQSNARIPGRGRPLGRALPWDSADWHARQASRPAAGGGLDQTWNRPCGGR